LILRKQLVFPKGKPSAERKGKLEFGIKKQLVTETRVAGKASNDAQEQDELGIAFLITPRKTESVAFTDTAQLAADFCLRPLSHLCGLTQSAFHICAALFHFRNA
jgi:hypothetical protein